MDPRVFLPVVKFVDKDSDIPFCCEVIRVLTKAKSPCIPMVIEDRCVPVLLDTGADVSTVSAQFVHDLMPDRVDNLGQMQVRTIGQLVPFKGPVTLKVEVCGVKLDHPFYRASSALAVYAMVVCLCLCVCVCVCVSVCHKSEFY